jgi:hypothetical protein
MRNGMARKKEYDIFVASLEELTQGQEKDISISDLTPRKVWHKKM